MLEKAFASRRGAEQAKMARDVFSLIHFPMMLGVIAYAVSIEEAVAHPDQPLPLVGRLALAVGLALFAGGTTAAIWQATRRLFLPRVILTVVTAIAVVAVSGVAPMFTLAIALVGIVVIAALEGRTGSPIL
jgi:low temperature requirement protein LtrA